MNNKNVVASPVKHNTSSVEIIDDIKKSMDFDEDESYGPAMEVPSKSIENKKSELLETSIKKIRKKELKNKKVSKELSFADQIKVDFIPSIDYRILCRFLGVTSVNEIKNHPFQAHPLITLILMEGINGFMKKEGYNFAGELNFDQHGNSIPPEKNPWTIKGKETTFTITGFLYFENRNGNKKDNISFFLYSDLDRGGSSITCYSTIKSKCQNIINNLQAYSKENNCLRGAKLKDINMITASFSEVEIDKKYTWDNFYYSDKIKDLFQLEVFDFIKNVKEYNKYGINKRGIIIFGKPGTGKTSIGNIICNQIPDNTVIWITPEILSENNYQSMSSIKALYKLADFLSPCVIILEDLDLFSQDRDCSGDILSLGALMNILDGINTITNSVTIGTTNRIESIEGALRNRPGRFDRIVEISTLSKDLRRKMLNERLKNWDISQDVLNYVIEKTGDWTGAEVQEFVNSLNLKYISSKKKKKKKQITKVWAEEIFSTMSDFGVGEKSSSFGFQG